MSGGLDDRKQDRDTHEIIEEERESSDYWHKQYGDLVVWLGEHHLTIAMAWHRSKIPFTALKNGTVVMTTRSGFGGSGGQILRVISQGSDSDGKKYVSLVRYPDSDDNTYLLYKDYYRDGPWYFSVAIMEDPGAYFAMNHREKIDWQLKNLGQVFG